MKVFYVFLLVLVFGVVSSHGRTHENNAAPTPFTILVAKPYDEFFLVQQWPASFCSVNHCPSIPRYFTVHGLWAQLNSGRSVTCSEKTFNIRKLKHNTQSDLNEYWPNLKGKGEGFWKHEYNTHASCIDRFQKHQDNYFSSTLTLAKENNVTTMLLNAGIQPGMKHYSISKIKNAILGAIKVKPTLQCNKAKDGTFQLFQIYLCFDKTASKLKNCRKLYRGCPKLKGNSLISFPLPGS